MCIFFDAGIGGGAPPEGTSSANTKLPAAVDLFDRVCAYALTMMKRSSSALANVYQGVFPGQSAPTDAEALATPFEGESTMMKDFVRAQTVRGSELTFRLLLGHEVAGNFEAVVSDFPRRPDGKTKSLNNVKAKASQLAVKLIDTFERKLAKAADLASKKSRSQSESAV